MESVRIKAMSTGASRIAYDGEDVREGRMDVRDLAPALLEIGALCERVNDLVNGDRAKITVNVRSDFKTGSFVIDLDVVQTILEQVKGVLWGHPVQDAKYILELLGLSAGGGILALYKWFRGKRATTASGNDEKTVTITINNVTTVIARDVIQLYNDDIVRERLEGCLRPLLKDGIDQFQVHSNQGREPATVETVTKEEVIAAYEARREEVSEQGEPPVLDSTYEAALEVVKIPFRDKLIWNFAQGKVKISAEMKDEVFLEKHRSGHTSFSVGDILIVRLRTRSWRVAAGLKVDHEVLEVKDHLHKVPQLTLGLGV